MGYGTCPSSRSVINRVELLGFATTLSYKLSDVSINHFIQLCVEFIFYVVDNGRTDSLCLVLNSSNIDAYHEHYSEEKSQEVLSYTRFDDLTGSEIIFHIQANHII